MGARPEMKKIKYNMTTKRSKRQTHAAFRLQEVPTSLFKKGFGVVGDGFQNLVPVQ